MVLQPETFGLSNEAEAVRWAFITVSVWWFIFMLPLVINYKEREVEKTGNFKEVFSGFVNTFRDIQKNKNVLLFLFAFFLYIDGVHTIMSLATSSMIKLFFIRLFLFIYVLLFTQQHFLMLLSFMLWPL